MAQHPHAGGLGTLLWYYQYTDSRVTISPTVEFTYNAHEDIMGSASYYTKQTGAVYEEHIYDVWGGVRWSTGYGVNDGKTLVIEPNYTGHSYDPILKIYHGEARFYDGKTRQWMASDPIKSGLNWYQYVESNPTNYVDPDGLEAQIVAGGGLINGNSNEDAEKNTTGTIAVEPPKAYVFYDPYGDNDRIKMDEYYRAIAHGETPAKPSPSDRSKKTARLIAKDLARSLELSEKEVAIVPLLSYENRTNAQENEKDFVAFEDYWNNIMGVYNGTEQRDIEAVVFNLHMNEWLLEVTMSKGHAILPSDLTNLAAKAINYFMLIGCQAAKIITDGVNIAQAFANQKQFDIKNLFATDGYTNIYHGKNFGEQNLSAIFNPTGITIKTNANTLTNGKKDMSHQGFIWYGKDSSGKVVEKATGMKQAAIEDLINYAKK